MPPLSDRSIVAVELKWLISIVVLLMGLASTAGVLIYQVGELRQQVAALDTQAHEIDRRTIEIAVTLKNQGGPR